jgi:catechol 2,3-dioxygenase-like lactoylglutathione lyase family enzyme
MRVIAGSVWDAGALGGREPPIESKDDAMAQPGILGLHHIRLPVSNVLVSRDWYAQNLGFLPILLEEDEEVTGVVLAHPCGVVIGLHAAPEQARALRGFAIVGVVVEGLGEWASHLDALGIAHTDLEDAHLGRCLKLADADGIVLDFHTRVQPSAHEA